MKNYGRKLELQDKIATATFMAILDINVESEEEKKEKNEYMKYLNKIICDFDEIKPIIDEYFKKKEEKER